MQVALNRLQHFLKLYRVPYSMIPHTPTFSSQKTAAAMHIPGRSVAKAVVLQGQSKIYLAVLPACFRVDLERFAKIVGEPVRLASEAKIRDLFPDCELGAIPPLGRLYGLQTYVDITLAGDREIVFPAGDHSDALRMSYPDFRDLAQPELCSFALQGAEAQRELVPQSGRVN